MIKIVSRVGCTVLALEAGARGADVDRVALLHHELDMSERGILFMYGIGVAAIALAWISIVGLFAWKGKLDELMDQVRDGPLIKFVTVTYIIVVIVTLGLIGKLESAHVSTLLGAIAGYVLGERSGQRQSRGQNTQES
jgi:predicted small integral membrane protein